MICVLERSAVEANHIKRQGGTGGAASSPRKSRRHQPRRSAGDELKELVA
jgi:hypothetical protein